MDKKLLRGLMLLITYTVLLILVLLRLDDLRGLLARVLEVLRPLLLGFALAFLLNRPCRFFLRIYRRGLPERACRPLAVVSAYVSMLAVITAVLSFLLPQVAASIELFISNLNGYIGGLQALVNALLTRLDLTWLESLDLSGLSDILRKMGTTALDAVTNAVPQLFTLTGALVSFVVTGVLALVFSVYLLSGADRLKAQCRRTALAYLPGPVCEGLFSVVRLTADTFTRFVSGQAVEACILGGLCCAGMLLLGLPYAPLVSVIVGVSALIPVAGAYLGAILSFLILVMVSPVKALIFLIFLVCLQQVEGNVIYPRVVGSSLGLPGLWVLTAVTVGGGLFGLWGMLLGVPVASVLYTLLRADVHRRLTSSDR